MTDSVYQDLTDAGIETASHESDLHCPDTPAAREIIAKHGVRFSAFRNAVDGTMWLDVPFCFDPWWDTRAR